MEHHKVHNEIDCMHALAVLGCSKAVLVIEALMTLEAEYTQVFDEKRIKLRHPEDIDLILDSLKSREDTCNCFCRLAHALYKGSSSSADPRLGSAISRTGARLFWAVAKVVAAKFPDNAALQNMLASDEARLQMIEAWSLVFTWKTERYIVSLHPYNDVIGGDASMAAKARQVLSYVAEKYEESHDSKRRNLGRLLQASLPFVDASIAKYRAEQTSREEEYKSEIERMKRLLLLPEHFEKD